MSSVKSSLAVVVTLATCVALSLASTVVSAQEPPTADAQCSHAVQAVHDRPLEALEAGYWSAATVCGREGGLALAAGLRAVASLRDTVALQRAEAALRRIKDAEVLSAAAAVATSASASYEARAVALRTLAVQHRADVSFVVPLFLDESSRRCRTFSVVRETIAEGNALPSDYVQRIFDAANEVVVEIAAPSELRLLAQCVRGVVQSALPRVPEPGTITVTHVCGQQFRVANNNSFGVVLRYELLGTDVTGSVGVGPSSVRRINVELLATLRVFSDGVTIATVEPSGTPCG